MKIPFSAFILLFICIFSSCSSENKENKDEMEILSVTDSFATKYYTWRFKDAARFSDEEFTRFLRFLSSNVNQKDIDVLTKSAETPGFSVDSVEIKEADLKAHIDIKTDSGEFFRLFLGKGFHSRTTHPTQNLPFPNEKILFYDTTLPFGMFLQAARLKELLILP